VRRSSRKEWFQSRCCLYDCSGKQLRAQRLYDYILEMQVLFIAPGGEKLTL
jgi:hypothetical protein